MQGAPKGNQFWKESGWRNSSYVEMVDILKKSNYECESHFCDVVEDNIELVSNKVFSEEYVTHIREYSFPGYSSRKPTADFLITTNIGNIIVECKVPKKRRDSSIRQILQYFVIAEKHNIQIHRWAIFTTEFNIYDAGIIERFKLPIELFYICNEKAFTVINGKIL